MNKHLAFKSIGLATVLAVLASCTNLDVVESDSLVVKATGGGFKSVNVADALQAAYNNLGNNFADQGGIYSLGEHPSAEMIPPTRGVDWGDNGVWRTLDQHTWDPTHSNVLSSWNNLNSEVFKATQILASSPSAAQAAEAKFLRAWNMSHVLDYWGQVPFRETTEGVDDFPKVKNRQEAFDFIVKDLTEALPALSEAKTTVAENPGATKAAANYLLAKMYLNKATFTAAAASDGGYTFAKADMDQVVKYVDAITTAGFKLSADYFSNFTAKATGEIILTGAQGSPQNRWMMTLHYDQNPSGWNGFTTLADFYDKFEATDSRKSLAPKKDGTNYAGIGKGFLIGQQFDDKGKALNDSRANKPLQFTRDVILAGCPTDKGIRVIKYHPADANKYILARYGDAYLMKAEALLRGGDAAGALAWVNALRKVRGATALATLDANAMFDEIGRETYWEGGKRTVEVRFGKFLSGTGVDRKDVGTVVYPIPADAIASNPNLKQNAGY